MRRVESSLSAWLHLAGTPKEAIYTSFRTAMSNGTSLTEELLAIGAVDEVALARAIAAKLGLKFETIPEHSTPIGSSPADLGGPCRSRRLTVATPEGSVLRFLAPSLAEIATLEQDLPEDPVLAGSLRITTPSQILECLRVHHEEELCESCIRKIEIVGGEQTSRVVLSGVQGIVAGACSSLVLIGLAMDRQSLWVVSHVVFGLFFFLCILLRLLAVRIAARREAEAALVPGRAVTFAVYSVLIALYKEAPVVPQIILAMEQLNWPRSRLEVLFLCEADDRPTLDAFSQPLPPNFQVVAVPDFAPRTKPKALNYGLHLAHGEFIVVYDAEDRPHPDQLREAWQRFETSGETLGCLQAPLVVSNARQCWLSRLFAFEYAMHFGGLLPWLARHRFVLPLGGSSNHFRRTCLDAVRGWDPFNVTEDAELGTRLARHGYEVGVISRPTWEDAPIRLDIWLRQRTRWLKGWMQTWLVGMRRPFAFMREVGLYRFVIYQALVMGIIVSSLLYPIMFIAIGTGAINSYLNETGALANWVFAIDCLNLAMGFLSYHALGRSSPIGKSISGSVLAWLPLYWLLISTAAWRGLWQLWVAPFLWEKTPHSPSQRGPHDAALWRRPPSGRSEEFVAGSDDERVLVADHIKVAPLIWEA